MKARLAKLLAVTVPALTALAIAPGSASAWSIQPYCSAGTGTLTVVSASSLYPKWDANKDGLVCVLVKSNTGVWIKDNGYILVF